MSGPTETHHHPPPARRLGHGQRGQSLVEVVIAAALTFVVLGAIGTLLVTSQRQQQKSANYDYAQASAQTELDAMVAQISDASNIVSWGPNSVDLNVNVNGSLSQVYYECDLATGKSGWNECVRLVTNVNAALPALSTATTVIPYLSNGTTAQPVFSWTNEMTAPGGTNTTPNLTPDYVTATIDVPASNGVTSGLLSIQRTIALSDGALIRNLDVEN